jgi:hypothetical protein
LYDGLKVYGKEPEQLSNAEKLFQMVLSDYDIASIEKAVRFYMRHNSEFPAPADIANIIERGNKPPFEKTYYVALSKKQPEMRTQDEWDYMRDYERFLRTGKN